MFYGKYYIRKDLMKDLNTKNLRKIVIANVVDQVMGRDFSTFLKLKPDSQLEVLSKLVSEYGHDQRVLAKRAALSQIKSLISVVAASREEDSAKQGRFGDDDVEVLNDVFASEVKGLASRAILDQNKALANQLDNKWGLGFFSELDTDTIKKIITKFKDFWKKTSFNVHSKTSRTFDEKFKTFREAVSDYKSLEDEFKEASAKRAQMVKDLQTFTQDPETKQRAYSTFDAYEDKDLLLKDLSAFIDRLGRFGIKSLLESKQFAEFVDFHQEDLPGIGGALFKASSIFEKNKDFLNNTKIKVFDEDRQEAVDSSLSKILSEHFNRDIYLLTLDENIRELEEYKDELKDKEPTERNLKEIRKVEKSIESFRARQEDFEESRRWIVDGLENMDIFGMIKGDLQKFRKKATDEFLAKRKEIEDRERVDADGNKLPRMAPPKLTSQDKREIEKATEKYRTKLLEKARKEATEKGLGFPKEVRKDLKLLRDSVDLIQELLFDFKGYVEKSRNNAIESLQEITRGDVDWDSINSVEDYERLKNMLTRRESTIRKRLEFFGFKPSISAEPGTGFRTITLDGKTHLVRDFMKNITKSDLLDRYGRGSESTEERFKADFDSTISDLVSEVGEILDEKVEEDLEPLKVRFTELVSGHNEKGELDEDSSRRAFEFMSDLSSSLSLFDKKVQLEEALEKFNSGEKSGLDVNIKAFAPAIFGRAKAPKNPMLPDLDETTYQAFMAKVFGINVDKPLEDLSDEEVQAMSFDPVLLKKISDSESFRDVSRMVTQAPEILKDLESAEESQMYREILSDVNKSIKAMDEVRLDTVGGSSGGEGSSPSDLVRDSIEILKSAIAGLPTQVFTTEGMEGSSVFQSLNQEALTFLAESVLDFPQFFDPETVKIFKDDAAAVKAARDALAANSKAIRDLEESQGNRKKSHKKLAEPEPSLSLEELKAATPKLEKDFRDKQRVLEQKLKNVNILDSLDLGAQGAGDASMVRVFSKMAENLQKAVSDSLQMKTLEDLAKLDRDKIEKRAGQLLLISDAIKTQAQDSDIASKWARKLKTEKGDSVLAMVKEALEYFNPDSSKGDFAKYMQKSSVSNKGEASLPAVFALTSEGKAVSGSESVSRLAMSALMSDVFDESMTDQGKAAKVYDEVGSWQVNAVDPEKAKLLKDFRRGLEDNFIRENSSDWKAYEAAKKEKFRAERKLAKSSAGLSEVRRKLKKYAALLEKGPKDQKVLKKKVKRLSNEKAMLKRIDKQKNSMVELEAQFKELHAKCGPLVEAERAHSAAKREYGELDSIHSMAMSNEDKKNVEARKAELRQIMEENFTKINESKERGDCSIDEFNKVSADYFSKKEKLEKLESEYATREEALQRAESQLQKLKSSLGAAPGRLNKLKDALDKDIPSSKISEHYRLLEERNKARDNYTSTYGVVAKGMADIDSKVEEKRQSLFKDRIAESGVLSSIQNDLNDESLIASKIDDLGLSSILDPVLERTPTHLLNVGDKFKHLEGRTGILNPHSEGGTRLSPEASAILGDLVASKFTTSLPESSSVRKFFEDSMLSPANLDRLDLRKYVQQAVSNTAVDFSRKAQRDKGMSTSLVDRLSGNKRGETGLIMELASDEDVEETLISQEQVTEGKDQAEGITGQDVLQDIENQDQDQEREDMLRKRTPDKEDESELGDSRVEQMVNGFRAEIDKVLPMLAKEVLFKDMDKTLEKDLEKFNTPQLLKAFGFTDQSQKKFEEVRDTKRALYDQLGSRGLVNLFKNVAKLERIIGRVPFKEMSEELFSSKEAYVETSPVYVLMKYFILPYVDTWMSGASDPQAVLKDEIMKEVESGILSLSMQKSFDEFVQDLSNNKNSQDRMKAIFEEANEELLKSIIDPEAMEKFVSSKVFNKQAFLAALAVFNMPYTIGLVPKGGKLYYIPDEKTRKDFLSANPEKAKEMLDSMGSDPSGKFYAKEVDTSIYELDFTKGIKLSETNPLYKAAISKVRKTTVENFMKAIDPVFREYFKDIYNRNIDKFKRTFNVSNVLNFVKGWETREQKKERKKQEAVLERNLDIQKMMAFEKMRQTMPRSYAAQAEKHEELMKKLKVSSYEELLEKFDSDFVKNEDEAAIKRLNHFTTQRAALNSEWGEGLTGRSRLMNISRKIDSHYRELMEEYDHLMFSLIDGEDQADLRKVKKEFEELKARVDAKKLLGDTRVFKKIFESTGKAKKTDFGLKDALQFSEYMNSGYLGNPKVLEKFGSSLEPEESKELFRRVGLFFATIDKIQTDPTLRDKLSSKINNKLSGLDSSLKSNQEKVDHLRLYSEFDFDWDTYKKSLRDSQSLTDQYGQFLEMMKDPKALASFLEVSEASKDKVHQFLYGLLGPKSTKTELDAYNGRKDKFAVNVSPDEVQEIMDAAKSGNLREKFKDFFDLLNSDPEFKSLLSRLSGGLMKATSQLLSKKALLVSLQKDLDEAKESGDVDSVTKAQSLVDEQRDEVAKANARLGALKERVLVLLKSKNVKGNHMGMLAFLISDMEGIQEQGDAYRDRFEKLSSNANRFRMDLDKYKKVYEEERSEFTREFEDVPEDEARREIELQGDAAAQKTMRDEFNLAQSEVIKIGNQKKGFLNQVGPLMGLLESGESNKGRKKYQEKIMDHYRDLISNLDRYVKDPAAKAALEKHLYGPAFEGFSSEVAPKVKKVLQMFTIKNMEKIADSLLSDNADLNKKAVKNLSSLADTFDKADRFAPIYDRELQKFLENPDSSKNAEIKNLFALPMTFDLETLRDVRGSDMIRQNLTAKADKFVAKLAEKAIPVFNAKRDKVLEDSKLNLSMNNEDLRPFDKLEGLQEKLIKELHSLNKKKREREGEYLELYNAQKDPDKRMEEGGFMGEIRKELFDISSQITRKQEELSKVRAELNQYEEAADLSLKGEIEALESAISPFIGSSFGSRFKLDKVGDLKKLDELASFKSKVIPRINNAVNAGKWASAYALYKKNLDNLKNYPDSHNSLRRKFKKYADDIQLRFNFQVQGAGSLEELQEELQDLLDKRMKIEKKRSSLIKKLESEQARDATRRVNMEKRIESLSEKIKESKNPDSKANLNRKARIQELQNSLARLDTSGDRAVEEFEKIEEFFRPIDNDVKKLVAKIKEHKKKFDNGHNSLNALYAEIHANEDLLRTFADGQALFKMGLINRPGPRGGRVKSPSAKGLEAQIKRENKIERLLRRFSTAIEEDISITSSLKDLDLLKRLLVKELTNLLEDERLSDLLV